MGCAETNFLCRKSEFSGQWDERLGRQKLPLTKASGSDRMVCHRDRAVVHSIKGGPIAGRKPRCFGNRRINAWVRRMYLVPEGFCAPKGLKNQPRVSALGIVHQERPPCKGARSNVLKGAEVVRWSNCIAAQCVL